MEEQNQEEVQAAEVEAAPEASETDSHNDELTVLRARAQELEQKNKLYEDHLALLQSKHNQPRGNEEAWVDPQEKLQKDYEKMQRDLEEFKVMAKYRDYEEVINNYLPEAIKENPSIRNWLINSKNPYEQAYYLAKKSDAFIKSAALKNKAPEAKKIAENATKKSLSSVGSSTAGSSTPDYLHMSDEDFMAHRQRILGY